MIEKWNWGILQELQYEKAADDVACEGLTASVVQV